jgi:hypothetical protein
MVPASTFGGSILMAVTESCGLQQVYAADDPFCSSFHLTTPSNHNVLHFDFTYTKERESPSRYEKLREEVRTANAMVRRPIGAKI